MYGTLMFHHIVPLCGFVITMVTAIIPPLVYVFFCTDDNEPDHPTGVTNDELGLPIYSPPPTCPANEVFIPMGEALVTIPEAHPTQTGNIK